MIATSSQLFRAALTAFALVFLGAGGAVADPMKCSGEEKVCSTDCRKVARVPLTVCLTACGARLSICLKTGCWDDGRQRYCGLSKL
jgi:hypothetical protein